MGLRHRLRGRTVPNADDRVRVFRRRRPGRQRVRALHIRHRVRPEHTVRVALRAGNTEGASVPDPVDVPGPRIVRRATPGGRHIQVNASACYGGDVAVCSL